jgi:predicted secreted protein
MFEVPIYYFIASIFSAIIVGIYYFIQKKILLKITDRKIQLNLKILAEQ